MWSQTQHAAALCPGRICARGPSHSSLRRCVAQRPFRANTLTDHPEEEGTKLTNYQVHPLDSDSAPYDFSLAENPLLRSAARALNLPARSSQSYLSLFSKTSPPTNLVSQGGSVVPELEQRYSGYFVVSGYNVSFVLPKEFPPRFRSRSSSTDSDRDSPSTHQTRSSFIKGRRTSVLGRPSLQFMAALELRVNFLSKVRYLGLEPE